MSRRPKYGIPVDVWPAEERVAALEAMAGAALAAGEFRFLPHIGYLRPAGMLSATDCGCAIGLVCSVLGGRGPSFQGTVDATLATGFVTSEELRSLELGYEAGEKEFENVAGKVRVESREFFEFGRRLRARPDATPTWRTKS